ncbi:MAG: AAA family ATPase, partial [Bacteroidota bacterium]|nr:AAA family ATPase [Bacteroidota bacterium]
MIARQIQEEIIKRVPENKAIILLGPRQSGKTTLLRQVSKMLNMPYIWFNGDDPADAALLTDSSVSRLVGII